MPSRLREHWVEPSSAGTHTKPAAQSVVTKQRSPSPADEPPSQASAAQTNTPHPTNQRRQIRRGEDGARSRSRINRTIAERPKEGMLVGVTLFA